MMYRNHEGYFDPTAGEALSNIAREAKAHRKKGNSRQLHRDQKRKKIYVASKYAGDIAANTAAAVRCCRYVVQCGGLPIASHLLYPAHGILRDDVPSERALGLAFGLALVGICDELWAFGKISSGMGREIKEAKRLGIPVKYLEVPS